MTVAAEHLFPNARFERERRSDPIGAPGGPAPDEPAAPSLRALRSATAALVDNVAALEHDLRISPAQTDATMIDRLWTVAGEIESANRAIGKLALGLQRTDDER